MSPVDMRPGLPNSVTLGSFEDKVTFDVAVSSRKLEREREIMKVVTKKI